MAKQKTTFLILMSIFLLALFLRVFQLGKTPSGFHADEASFYINAVSIAKTAADEDGRSLPLSLYSLIDPKPAVYSYLQVPFLQISSDYIFNSRIPAVILSIFSLLVLYLLVQKLANRQVAVLTTAVVALSPWHIMVTRGTQEVIASFLFLVLSLYLLVKVLENKKHSIINLFLLFTASFLSMYFYHSAKVLLPLLAFGLVTYFYKKSKEFYKQGFLTVCIVLFAVFTAFFVQESGSRIKAVGILSDKAPMQHLTEQIYTLHRELPIFVVRVFYNKIQAYATAFSTEYLVYFSPDFLFLNGGKPHRYIVPDHGLLYLIELPLFLIGLYSAIRSKNREYLLFLGVLIISPIPAALTTLETPSIIRSFPMILGFAYFIALGLLQIYKLTPLFFRYAVLLLVAGVYIWQVQYFLIQYHIQAKYDQPWYRNNPYTEIAQAVAKIHTDYSQVTVTNDLRPLYAYFVIEGLISIEELQQNPHARDEESYALGKFSFNRDVCSFPDLVPGVLYIAETTCRQTRNEMKNLEVVAVISYPDGAAVYELLQVSE